MRLAALTIATGGLALALPALVVGGLWATLILAAITHELRKRRK